MRSGPFVTLLIAALVVAGVFYAPQRAGAAAAEAGIDVSSFQGGIGWSSVAASGIAFAYIRAGEGCCARDLTFRANWAGAAANGIQRGAYLYFHPGEDANAEATLLLQQLQSVGFHRGDLIPVADVETTDGLPSSAVASALRTFVNDVATSIGVLPAIYTAPTWWDDNVGSSAFTADPLWVANWCGSCAAPTLPAAGWGGFGFRVWQYTDAASVPGISGSVDGDRGNGALPVYPGLSSATLPQRLSPYSAVSGDVQAVAMAPGVNAVFWRAPDNHLVGRFEENGAISYLWGVGLPADMASDPAVAVLPGGGIDVFWASTSRELWMVSSTDSWAARDLGIGSVASAPSAAAGADGAVTVAWTRTDHSVWLTTLTEHASAMPYALAGASSSSAARPVYFGAGSLAVFWTGADGNLWSDVNTGAGWSAPGNLGNGPLSGDPLPISPVTGIIDVFWRGADGIIWEQSHSGGWSEPAAVSGADMGSAPAIVPTTAGFIVYVRDPLDDVWVSSFSASTGWSPPTMIGAGAAGSALSAAASGGPGHGNLYWSGTDGALYEMTL